MYFRKLGNSDLNMSVITLGTWGMGGDFWGKVDDELSIATIQAGLDAGITTIDTAPCYGAGHSEEVVGKAIKAASVKISSWQPKWAWISTTITAETALPRRFRRKWKNP